eukprot:TRINITY_DN16434_c0_g1_i2.p1 TRINITY_DN16434_c0_g1~~TRINITY_DN16434_c0_g1_i2.p1  ORF type:complete len:132 (+),score=26.00 TRINITY_DN16434_c0_g1_i2:267-662(+)
MYSSAIQDFFEGIGCFAVVYDVNNKRSFENARLWVERCRRARGTIPGVLIGTKTDKTLDEFDGVLPEQAEKFSRKHQLRSFLCSALRYEGVEEPADHLAEEWCRRFDDVIGRIKQQQMSEEDSAMVRDLFL